MMTRYRRRSALCMLISLYLHMDVFPAKEWTFSATRLKTCWLRSSNTCLSVQTGPHEVMPCKSMQVSISKRMRRFLERSSAPERQDLFLPFVNQHQCQFGVLRQIQRHGPGALLYRRPTHSQ
ncbi:hypothetical protein FOWG_07891 [Fusarium oxysporum f. sp. lycopersici MN25]|nr:hypothetical protein FOWG_07891 [Fusarium oxysporum f. sp. lycopersici MN25]